MINYSIVMRGVNSNLFEINQAKGRIKATQAKGEFERVCIIFFFGGAICFNRPLLLHTTCPICATNRLLLP